MTTVCCSGQTDAELKNVVEMFEERRRYDYWAEQVNVFPLSLGCLSMWSFSS